MIAIGRMKIRISIGSYITNRDIGGITPLVNEFGNEFTSIFNYWNGGVSQVVAIGCRGNSAFFKTIQSRNSTGISASDIYLISINFVY